MNDKINELYNNLDAKDKIINEQVLEIARLEQVEKEYIYEHRLYEKEIARLKEKIGGDRKQIKNTAQYKLELAEQKIELLQNDLDAANSKLSDLMKSHLEAIEYIKATIKIIKEQPSSCELNDIWILEHLNSFLEILGDKE